VVPPGLELFFIFPLFIGFYSDCDYKGESIGEILNNIFYSYTGNLNSPKINSKSIPSEYFELKSFAAT